MLTDSLNLSVDNLRVILLNDLSIFNIAISYVLVYVVYKTLGRYIYFSPQEHTSKVNRTFLVLSLLIIGLNLLSKINYLMPVLPEYRWIFTLSLSVILISPLSIVAKRALWKYHKNGGISLRDWAYRYLPISRDYYKTTTGKSESHGNMSHQWEEETVESTSKNLHSDVLINFFALLVFTCASIKWIYTSYLYYGWLGLLFSLILVLWVLVIFIDRGIYSWIEVINKKWQ